MIGRWLAGRWLVGRWLLGRYRRSDTGLGAAVTGLPSGPLRWAAQPPAPVAPSVLVGSHVRVTRAEPAGLPSVPPQSVPLQSVPLQSVPPEVAALEVTALEVVALGPARVGPQVVLGFRDGSEAALDPESEQARALEGLARTLTLRD